MGSTLTVDNIKDSGDNTLVSSTGSGHTLASGVVSSMTGIPAAGVTGLLSSLSALKVHTVTFQVDTGSVASGYNFGDALTIPSADNPDGAIFLVIGGGGRILTYPDGVYGTLLKYLEGGASWTTTNGIVTPEIITPMYAYTTLNKSYENGLRIAKYTNSSGGATQVDFKMSTYTSSGTLRVYANASHHKVGIITIRIH
jgi:hypothetical protein